MAHASILVRAREGLYIALALFALLTFILAAAFIGTAENDCELAPLQSEKLRSYEKLTLCRLADPCSLRLCRVVGGAARGGSPDSPRPRAAVSIPASPLGSVE